jgi:hypothetical protein
MGIHLTNRLILALWIIALPAKLSYSQTDSIQNGAPNDGPMIIAATDEGPFAHGQSWYLRVDASGRAVLKIATTPDKTILEFDVPSKDLLALKDEITKQGFFDLQNQYGKLVPDGSTRTISITIGSRTKSIRLDYLMATEHDKEYPEIVRALKIAQLIRGWFDDPRAADARRYDNLIINGTNK